MTWFPTPPDALSGLAFAGDPDVHLALRIEASHPTSQIDVWESTAWVAVYANHRLVKRYEGLNTPVYLEAVRFAVELHAVEVLDLGEVVDWDALSDPYDRLTEAEHEAVTDYYAEQMQERDRLGREEME